VLVQREMESGRAPLAEYNANSEAQLTYSRKRLRPGGRRPNRNWFQEKGSHLGGSHSQEGTRRSGKPTGYEKNIE
jgi:hypothetical protein